MKNFLTLTCTFDFYPLTLDLTYYFTSLDNESKNSFSPCIAGRKELLDVFRKTIKEFLI